MNLQSKIAAINSWQDNEDLHSYTCPYCGKNLFPAINEKVILNCECGYQQSVPPLIYRRYNLLRMLGLEKQ